MAKIAENNAETTEKMKNHDVFNELLANLKITGSILLNEHYAPPWAVAVPQCTEFPVLSGGGKHTHIAAFHLVRRGFIEVELENGLRETVNEGEMVVCFTGKAHILSQGKKIKPRSFTEIMQEGNNIFEPEKDALAQSTSLICGIFILHNTFLNPLFEALPPLLKVSKSEGSYYSVSTTAAIIELLQKEMEQQSSAHEFIIARYLELLCVKSIQQYTHNIPLDQNGWLRAINDPLVSQIISAIHLHPEKHWSVSKMADQIALSPSRFAARFSVIMGIAPMAYVAQWRIYLALKLLADTQDSVEQISLQTGYENVAAFGRAFKRHTGVSPGKWRRGNGKQGISNEFSQ